MEFELQEVFKKLLTHLKDDSKSSKSERLLESFHRNLIEEQVDSALIDSCMAHFFHTKHSLLHYIDEAAKIKSFKKACKVAVDIIYIILNNFYNRIQEKDLFELYKVARRIFKSADTDSLIKEKVFNLVLRSLEKDNGENDATVMAEYKKLLDAVLFCSTLKSGDKVKGKELELLGYITKKFPYIIDDATKVRIKQSMFKNFGKVSPLILRNGSNSIVRGLFTGFSYYLESAPFNLGLTEDKRIVDNMYKILKHLVILKEGNRTGNRAAMEFLGEHTVFFKNHLTKDYTYWHEKLLLWLTFGTDEPKVALTVLKAIYQCIAKSVEDSNDATCIQIIEYFLNYCKAVLKTKETSTLEKRLAVFCLREFSQSFHRHLDPTLVNDLFLFVMQVFEKTFVQDYKEDQNQWEYLPDYIQTIANFMRFKQLAPSEFYCVQNGAISMIKLFHMLPVLQHYIVTDALLLTTFYLKDTQYFNKFVENIVYQGVVWCCSHQHISVEAFLEDSPQKIVTIKDYYPLWDNILNLHSYTRYNKYGFDTKDRKYILATIIQELVKTLMILINKLNVSVKLKEEDSALTDFEQIYQLEESNDYSIFLNVVDFYKFIFDKTRPDYMKNSVCKMIDHLVAKSLKHPLNSGFYKLLSYCLKISRQLSLFDESTDSQEVNNCKETLNTFLPVLLQKMSEFKDDLLISSLQVLLETPVTIITHILPICVTPFINVFEVGRSYLPLAEMGVETLEHWQKTLPSETFEQFLGKIIPSLDTFLRSKSLKGYSTQPVQKRRKTLKALKKRTVLEETEPELVKLQRKILSFIGRQSFKTCQDFVFTDSIFVKSLISGQSSHLKVTLPYDIQLDMHLDTFLPRIIELALYSSDRKTRITSCELLQACTMVFLGKAKQMSSAGLEELNDMLKTIATPLLLLSCDIDQVVRQIFQPLFLQIVHWYTSPKARGIHTNIIIETLLEGITHPTNSVLKDFSGKCLSEFVKWTIKHENVDPTSSIKILIKNMRFFSSHPDPIKKLGAALIFNSTYRELREEERVVNVFWIEILHILVMSLDSVIDLEETSTVAQINRSLGHLQRVIMEKPAIFRKRDKKRRIPNDLGDGVLTDLAIWLLSQTGSRSIHCRQTCMGLFINIAPLSSASKINLQQFIEDNLDTTVESLYDVKLIKFSSLSEQSYCDCANFLNYLRNLLCCLDGYKFIVKNNLETVNFDEVIFSEVQVFLAKLQVADLSTCLSLIAPKTWSFTTLDKDMFLSLKSACILSILKLYNAIIHNEVIYKKSNSIWTNDFYKLVACLVLCPQELGLVHLINTEYTEILVILLNTLPNKLPKTSIATMRNIFMDIIQNYKYCPIDLEKNMPLKQRNLLKGVVLLHSTTIGQDMKLFPHANSLVETFFRDFGQGSSDGTIFINHIQDTTINYTNDLLKFVFSENNSVLKLLDPIHSDVLVQSVDTSRKLPFGLYICNTFAQAIVPTIVQDFETFLKLSLDKNNIKLTLDLLIVVLTNVVKEKQYKQSFNEIANCITKFWNHFSDYLSSSTEATSLGMTLLSLFVQICDSGSDEMQDWLVDCLIRGNGIECIEIFELLAKITKSDISEERGSSLKTSLMLLSEKISSQSTNQEIVTNSFNKLLTFFPVVKSTIIFEYLTEIYVKIPPSVDITMLLRKFMNQLEISVHPLFLEHIYAMTMKKDEHWYKIAKDLLPVVFQLCNMDAFNQFFVNNIQSMLTILKGSDLEQSIVIFILVEVLFLRIPIGTEERQNCDICAAAGEPKLLQKLLGFALNAFKVAGPEGDLLRQYKCHAYNAMASIISNSVRKEAFYNKLFIREDNNVDILWKGIINTEIKYDFPKNFESLPTQKKILVNIRDELRKSRHNAGTMPKSLQYIESQRLFNSSLSEDVTKFDFTNSVLRSKNVALKKMNDNRHLQVEIFLDSTEINEHECMGTVCSLIQHMFDTGVCRKPFDDDEDVVLPDWMKGLKSMLLNDTTHKNVKIFLVKVIDNMIDIFNHYAKFFLEPLIKFIVDLSAGNTINYFVTDMLVIISKWASMIPNLSDQEAVLASKLLEFLIKNLERDRQDVFKYNIELLKLMVEAWKKHLRVPVDAIKDLFSSETTSEVGVYVSSVLLVNGLEPWKRGEEHAFLELMLKPLKSKTRRIFRACAETLGPMLNVLKADEYVEKVRSVLQEMSPIDKYIACLEGIAIKYPLIVDNHHAARIISTLNQVTAEVKPICLKIILRRVEVSLDILEQLNDFQIVNWDEHIEDSALDIQIVTLELIKKCLTYFVKYSCFEEIVASLGRNIYHPNAIFRSCLFELASAIYKTKSDPTNTCKDILILGLVDPDVDIQKKIFDFWEDNAILPQTIIDRFSFLLSEMYKLKIEDKLLGLSSYFLVNMLTTSEKYEGMLFEHPLEDCEFEEYNLETNWKLQHPSVVPMFAETLDINTLTSLSFSGEDRDIFALRQTQTTFQFAPTQSFHEEQLSKHTSLSSTLGMDLDTTFKNPNTVNISQKYRVNRRRFLKNKSAISNIMANYETQKKITAEKKRKEAAIEREKKVTIYRNYRKGDFPDVQIALSALLKPLQMLALHDNEMSKTLFIEVFKGLASKIENNQSFLSSVSTSIKHIFQSSIQFNRYLFGALLDILLKNKENMVFDSKLISYVAQESGLASTGALLIEEYLISGVGDDTPSTSKRKFREDAGETVSWIKLAELYKELEEWDTVRAIFLEKMDCKQSLQKALTLESKYLYKDAADLYKELIVSDQSHNKRDFYYDAYFKCFANLGEWENIPNAIESVVGAENTWKNLWEDEWFKQKLLPWYITSHVKNQLFTQETNNEFLKDLNSCLSDSRSEEYLNIHFSEELCMLWLCEKEMHTAKRYLRTAEKNFLEDWQLLNPMFQSQRFQKLLKLQNIIEIADFIEIFKTIDNIESSLPTLRSRWSSIPIEASPSLILSETKLLYRKQFINNILEKLSTMEGLDTKPYKRELNISKLSMDIDMITMATENESFSMARKYLRPYEKKDHPKLHIAKGILYLLKSNMVKRFDTKMEFYIEAIKIFKSPVAESVELAINNKLFDALTDVSELMSSNTELLSTYGENISSALNTRINTTADLETYAWNTLKCSIEKCNTEEMESDEDRNDTAVKFKRVADTYIKLAHFIRNKNDTKLDGEFILFVLRAIKLNSSEARQLFPCILMQETLANKHKELFLKETEQIPTWMFLGWIPQLLANVDTSKIYAVSKLIQRISDTYPQAIMYPYRLSKENYNFVDDGVQREAKLLTDRLDEQLLKDAKVNKFLKALSYVSIPYSMLRYYLSKIKASSDINIIRSYLQSIQEDIFDQAHGTNDVNNMQGNMFDAIKKYGKHFTKMLDIPIDRVKKYAIELEQQLLIVEANEVKKKIEPSRLLKDYCPWIANFSANKLNMELEIPGQYDGQKLPVPQHHVKISGFHPEVAIMKSLRKPIKIRMIGMNTKEYPFLIKFGEDIRQDQRIQQLFCLINNILKSDMSCSNNGLDILTYQVIPLTSNLGLIQWINDIDSLSEFIKKSLKREQGTYASLEHEYAKFISRGITRSYFDIYGTAALTLKKDKVVCNYNSLVKKIPWDIFRTSFWTLSTSTENYIALRNNFIKTYSVMCATHWILGIGDRHLNNSSICLRNGKVLGIDFGHAFGTATQILPVPELVPFRLTPHIVSLMEPLKERGPFREYMIHCLKCLRANSSSLLATMNVFIQEPSLDWLEHTETGEDRQSNTWYPAVKLNQAKRKLKGVNSVDIMVEELRDGTRNQTYTDAYIKLVLGEASENLRAQFKGKEDLTVEDQVDCLIDHATDYNLLGRMWVGWYPWV